MSKTLTEAQVTTAKARSRLELGVHWRRLDAESHLGYRKGKLSFPAGPIGGIMGHAHPYPPPRSRRQSNQETWLIHYDDIRVGSIALRAGVPADKDQWGWSVGFYPASDRGLRASGTAKTFDAAPAAFDMAWQWLFPKFKEVDFADYRRHRAFDAWKHAMWDAGLKLPTQVADGRSTCFCGAAIGIAEMERHVYAAHMETA